MPYVEGRVVHDADAHIMEWPDWLPEYADPDVRDRVPHRTLDDGSGLSNKNRVAAKAFTTVLAHVAARPDAGLFVSTLAVPGEDGTLERRFRATKSGVADHVHAKTGHISGVSTLSGYVQLDGPGGKDRGRLFAFSILCNKYQGNVNPWQDQVCEALYQWVNGK